MVKSDWPGSFIIPMWIERKTFGVILKHKGLPDLSWDDFLPESYGGFRRLIKPNDAVRIINGST